MEAHLADCSAVERWWHKKTHEKTMRQRVPRPEAREPPSPVPRSSQEDVLEESLVDGAREQAVARGREHCADSYRCCNSFCKFTSGPPLLLTCTILERWLRADSCRASWVQEEKKTLLWHRTTLILKPGIVVPHTKGLSFNPWAQGSRAPVSSHEQLIPKQKTENRATSSCRMRARGQSRAPQPNFDWATELRN